MKKIYVFPFTLLTFAAVTAYAGEPPPGFSRLSDIAPDIAQEMRYATRNNFTGKVVAGYRSPQCWLRTEVAQALAKAQRTARARGFSLVVYDCYRPQRAVQAFVEWSHSRDQSTRKNYYPGIAKNSLFAQGYIAEHSAHSTGLAIDIGVVGWRFGTPFDFFDRRSWTDSPVAPNARAHRDALVALLEAEGFKNYPREWWHFSFGDPQHAPAYDVEIE
jgi:D-alanyl-D-alanine dipeptidase